MQDQNEKLPVEPEVSSAAPEQEPGNIAAEAEPVPEVTPADVPPEAPAPGMPAPAPAVAVVPLSRKQQARMRVRGTEERAAAVLGRRDAMPPLVIAFLFFLTIPVAALVLYSFFSALIIKLNAPLVLLDVAFGVSALLAVLGTAPAFCGRMRLAGLTLTGGAPAAREVLYFYTTPALWWRSVLLFVVHVLALALPYVVAFGGISLASAIFADLAFVSGWAAFAVVCIVAISLASLILGAVIFLLTGRLLPVLGIGIGNPSLSVRETIRASLRISRGHARELALFRVRNIARILLSLLTVGVLYVLYFAHRIQIAYLDLCISLKGDPK